MGEPKNKPGIRPTGEMVRDGEAEREAAVDESSLQDHRDETDPAEGHMTFNDDKITPRLNDGR